MAYNLIRVEGTILGPNGEGVYGGYIEYGLDQIATVNDGNGIQQVLGKQRVSINGDGFVEADVISNDDITPAGTRYNVLVVPSTGVAYHLTWNVPNTPASQDIGGILV